MLSPFPDGNGASAKLACLIELEDFTERRGKARRLRQRMQEDISSIIWVDDSESLVGLIVWLIPEMLKAIGNYFQRGNCSVTV